MKKQCRLNLHLSFPISLSLSLSSISPYISITISLYVTLSPYLSPSLSIYLPLPFYLLLISSNSHFIFQYYPLYPATFIPTLPSSLSLHNSSYPYLYPPPSPPSTQNDLNQVDEDILKLDVMDDGFKSQLDAMSISVINSNVRGIRNSIKQLQQRFGQQLKHKSQMQANCQEFNEMLEYLSTFMSKYFVVRFIVFKNNLSSCFTGIILSIINALFDMHYIHHRLGLI